MNAQDVKDELQKSANAEDAEFLKRFFKTASGQYGEGDVFIGVRMGPNRAAARKFKDLNLSEIQKLLDSKVHEHRMTGLLILTIRYPKAELDEKQKIYEFYLKNVYKGRVNNWDLIDVTCPRVVGAHLVDKPRDVIFELVRSPDLWQRRVGVLATFTFIAKGDPSTSLEISEILLQDEHDLIQKAVGWMLREIGKRCDRAILLQFLDDHSHEMPRTMLRYSIEHLTAVQRQYYMSQKSLK